MKYKKLKCIKVKFFRRGWKPFAKQTCERLEEKDINLFHRSREMYKHRM